MSFSLSGLLEANNTLYHSMKKGLYAAWFRKCQVERYYSIMHNVIFQQFNEDNCIKLICNLTASINVNNLIIHSY